MRYTKFTALLSTCLLIGLALPLSAQEGKSFKQLSGTVFDASSGQTMNGVRVRALELPRYTTLTDSVGQFNLEVPASCAVIEFIVNGFNRAEVPLQDQEEGIVVHLYDEFFKPDNEIVSRSSNVARVSDFRQTNALSIDDELELYSPVRSIHRSGTPAMGAAMFINGFHSLHSSSQPLIVIDGIIQENQESKQPIHDGYYNNLLSAIDVDDIENVTVLNNGTALYGAKGGNGVILIETKRARDMATHIDAHLSCAVDFPSRQLPMMDAANFRLYASDLLGRSFGTAESFSFLEDDESRLDYAKYHNNTDWSDYIYRQGITQKYGVSVRGGDQVAMYNLSLGYSNSESVLEANNYSRLNIRFNTDINLIKRLYLRTDVAYSNTRRQLFDDGAPEDYTSGTILSTGFLSLIKAPILYPYKYDLLGNPTSLLEDADDYGIRLGGNNSFSNPLAINQYGAAINKNYQQYDMFTMVFEPKYVFNQHLSAQSTMSLSFTDETEKYFSPMTGTTTFYVEGKGTTLNHAMSQFIRKKNLAVNTFVNWENKGLVSELRLRGGFRFNDSSYESNMISGYNTGSDKMPNISGSLQFREVVGDDDNWRNLAYYGELQWNIHGKYYTRATLCLESSSRFGKDGNRGLGMFGVRWGVFPSLQAGWFISSEDFMQQVSFVDQLKWTAGIDISGNDNLDNYASHTYFQSVAFLGNTTGIQLANIGNNSLTWEETRRLHTGIDVKMLNNRLGINVEVYDDYTSHLLTLKQLKDIAGQDSYWSNDGALRNRGFDLSIYGKLINLRKFKWDMGVNVGHYQNVICSLPDNDKSFITTLYGGDILTAVGQAAGVFYGYRTNGVFATSTQAAESGLYQHSSVTGLDEEFQAGDIIFEDKDHNQLIDNNDRFVLGDPNPVIYGHIDSRFAYGRWGLHANFKYSYGNDIYNYLRRLTESGNMVFNQTKALQRRWVTEGQETDIPRVAYGDPTGNSRFSDRWIEDGSFLKLKKLTLSYDLPINGLFIQGLNLYGSVENVFTLTSYLGSDPENSMNNNVLYQGIDRGLTASGRSYVLGMKISL